MAEQMMTKQEKEWNKQLTQHLERYLSLKDWSELAAWLSKLKTLFVEKRGNVQDKNTLQTLIKRLATSLNPSLPIALHEATLELYELFLQHSIITGEELHLACVGLFSFFSQANTKNKHRMVDIFTKYFPKFGTDVQVLATGLIITVLPSLNEMHDGLIRDTTSLLDLMAKPEYVGQEGLAESVWVAILRSPSCRVAGLKYLSAKLGRGVEEEENDDEDDFWNEPSSTLRKTHIEESSPTLKSKQVDFKELLRDYCPRIETLIINALTICIEDSNILAIKAGLDFLYKYLPLKSEALPDHGKLRLAKCVVWLLGKRDTSVTRKINLWLFGKPDDQNRYNIQAKQLNFIVQALIGFLREDSRLQPLKIAFNLFTEHEEMPKLALGDLFPWILQFCKKQETNQEVLKIMHRMIERLQPHLHIVSQSIAEGLRKAIHHHNYEQAQKLLNLAVFFVSKILKPEEQKPHIRPFLVMLLESTVNSKWEHHQFSREALRQSLEVIEKYKDLLREEPFKPEEKELLEGHAKLYRQLVEKTRFTEKQGQNFEEEIWLISKFIVKSEELFEVFSEQWVDTLLDNLALTNPQHFLSPIEIIGEALQKEGNLKKTIIARSDADKSKNNCIRVSMGKLWGILSLGHLQSKVMTYLLRLVKHFPHFFQSLLAYDFESSGQVAIIKFRLFWQVSPKHPYIMSSDQVQQTNKYGLFRMLEFLDSGNPLVKYHSHLWITEAYQSYHRVLNPILEIMLKPKHCWYRTPQGQYIYAVEPQTQRILQSLRYLKSLVRLVPDQFNKFAFKPLTTKILPYYKIFKGEDPGQGQHDQIPYIAPLLQLILRYTESKFVGGNNKGIDLAACELLEAIAKSIRTYQVSNFLLKYHFRSILRSLHFATINQEHLLQIQLISLLQLILVESDIRRLTDGTILTDIVTHESFSATILEGVGSSFPYIKQRFVWFLNESIPLILERHSNCSEVVSRIFNTYTNKIAYANSKKVEANSLKDIQISQKNAEILILFEGVKELLSQFLNLHLQPFEKEKNQHDTDSGLFSFYSYKAFIHLKIERKPGSHRHKKVLEEQFIAELPQLLSMMAECWTLSELHVKYGLTREGLPVFDYEHFLSYNRTLGLAQSKLETEDTIESYLVNMLRILLNTYRNETMRALVKCWADATKDPDTRKKILELLIFSALPVEHFFAMLTDAMAPEKTSKRRRLGTLQFQQNLEQDVLQLSQAFTQYSVQNAGLFQHHNLINIWLSFFRFIKLFENTRSVLSLYTLIELIDVFLSKNNPKEIMRDEKIKREWAFIGSIFSELIAVCCGKLKVDMGSASVICFTDFLPLPSSVYQLKLQNQKEENELPLPFLDWEEVEPAKAAQYLRMIGLIIGKRMSYNLIASLYNESEIILVKKVKEVITLLLPLVEDKSMDMGVEGASEMILCLLEKKPIFVKELKSEILHMFNKEDFFICSSRTLQNWAKIIDLLIDHNKDHDIFNEYLEKVSLATSLFSSYTVETKKKIKSFERICFILYAGKKDKYTDKAQSLIDKIIEVTKNAEAPQPVLILIFFCIRILILRTSAERLTKLLSTIWQNIIFLLNKTFNTSAVQNQLNQHWAALKLIEMISLMQIAEFHPHQWMFFYDFVGVRFTSEVGQQGREVKLSIYPKIHQFLPSGIRMVKEESINLQEKRHLIIKEDKIDDLELLKTKALLLSSYLVASNGCKMHFDMREVEELIDNDFLNLDEFIFKV